MRRGRYGKNKFWLQCRYHLDGATQVDDTRNKYCLRLALTDLRAVSYASEQYLSQAMLDNTRTVWLNQLDNINFDKLNALTSSIQRLVSLRKQSRRFTSYLPTALRLTADYQKPLPPRPRRRLGERQV